MALMRAIREIGHALLWAAIGACFGLVAAIVLAHFVSTGQFYSLFRIDSATEMSLARVIGIGVPLAGAGVGVIAGLLSAIRPRTKPSAGIKPDPLP
jgi:hypothetical protein